MAASTRTFCLPTAGSARVARVALFGRRLAVIAHRLRQRLDLVGGEALQIGVLDEVRRVLVVLGGGDVEADVVEQRGELEQLAVGVGQAVQRAQAAEEIERQARDVLGVRLVGVAAARQAHDASAARRSGYSSMSWMPGPLRAA